MFGMIIGPESETRTNDQWFLLEKENFPEDSLAAYLNPVVWGRRRPKSILQAPLEDVFPRLPGLNDIREKLEAMGVTRLGDLLRLESNTVAGINKHALNNSVNTVSKLLAMTPSGRLIEDLSGIIQFPVPPGEEDNLISQVPRLLELIEGTELFKGETDDERAVRGRFIRERCGIDDWLPKSGSDLFKSGIFGEKEHKIFTLQSEIKNLMKIIRQREDFSDLSYSILDYYYYYDWFYIPPKELTDSLTGRSEQLAPRQVRAKGWLEDQLTENQLFAAIDSHFHRSLTDVLRQPRYGLAVNVGRKQGMRPLKELSLSTFPGLISIYDFNKPETPIREIITVPDIDPETSFIIFREKIEIDGGSDSLLEEITVKIVRGVSTLEKIELSSAKHRFIFRPVISEVNTLAWETLNRAVFETPVQQELGRIILSEEGDRVEVTAGPEMADYMPEASGFRLTVSRKNLPRLS